MELLCAAALLLFVTGPLANADPLQPAIPNESQLYPLLPVPVPEADPFYADPADFDQYQNGDIIRRRDVTSWFFGIPWPPVHTEQLLYRTTDTDNRPVATVTTVLVPGIPWIGPGSRPLISYQEAIDSMDSSCNPSHTLRTGTMKETQLLLQFLGEGMAVSVPDFDGKTMTFVSDAEGRAVLDGIRATRRAGLGMENSSVGMWGYSGGGNATAQASEQHATYAPELPIKGAAQGGVPADKIALLDWATRPEAGQATFIGWAGLIGLARSYPDLFSLDQILDTEGLRVAQDLSTRCIWSFLGSTVFKPVNAYLKNPQSFEDPGLREALRRSTPGRTGLLPDIPIFQWHGATDPILPMNLAISSMRHNYCSSGVNMRFFSIPATEHISAEIVGYEPSLIWLTAVLANGDPGPVIC